MQCYDRQIEEDEMGGTLEGIETILVGNLQGKRPFGRTKCVREDNIQT